MSLGLAQTQMSSMSPIGKKYRLGTVSAAGAVGGDEHARQRGTGAARDVEDDGVETDGVGEIVGRDDIGDDRRARRLLKRLHHRHAERGGVDMPGFESDR